MRVLTLLFLSAATAIAAEVSGVIKLDGPQPKRPPLQLTPESRKLYEGKPYPRDEVELVSPKGEIKNVFVYIRKGLPAGKTYPAPKNRPYLTSNDPCFAHVFKGCSSAKTSQCETATPSSITYVHSRKKIGLSTSLNRRAHPTASRSSVIKKAPSSYGVITTVGCVHLFS